MWPTGMFYWYHINLFLADPSVGMASKEKWFRFHNSITCPKSFFVPLPLEIYWVNCDRDPGLCGNCFSVSFGPLQTCYWPNYSSRLLDFHVCTVDLFIIAFAANIVSEGRLKSCTGRGLPGRDISLLLTSNYGAHREAKREILKCLLASHK